MRSRTLAPSVCLGLAFLLMSSAAQAQYKLTNLVSNQVGQAVHTDPLLVNAWGLTYGPGGPFWISDNKTGWSTLYSGFGLPHKLQVVIPSANGKGPGSPTGIVFNGSPDFQLKGAPTFFLFATLDGTISGWPSTNPSEATIAVNNSGSGAVYTGLAITSNASGNFLFAADSANNKVDMYDGTFRLVNSFTDKTLPPNFTPFGIQDVNGIIYVMFADSTGGKGGFIDMYTEDGVFIKQLAHGAPLNQPWGIAAAPPNFGPLSNTLLVSNNTNDGTINAFNAVTGQFVGIVKDENGKTIHIDQLWGIEFGGGSPNNGLKTELFFTAGPHNNLAGTFGKISLSK